MRTTTRIILLCFFEALVVRISVVHGEDQYNHVEEVISQESMLVSNCNSTSTNACSDNSQSNLCPLARHNLFNGTELELSLQPKRWMKCISSLSKSIATEDLEVHKVERSLVGNGAHRQLRTSITIKSRKAKECNVVIAEKLPNGLFADIFELDGFVARAYVNATVYGDHNLELPAPHSSESIVVVHTTAVLDLDGDVESNTMLPLHARYPALSLQKHVDVKLNTPYVLIDCFDADQHKDTVWTVLSWNSSNSSGIHWAVPAGNPLHSKLVAVTTASSALLGVVILFAVSMYSFSSEKIKMT